MTASSGVRRGRTSTGQSLNPDSIMRPLQAGKVHCPLQDDHRASAGPRNPNWPFLSWYQEVSTWPAAMQGSPQRLPIGGPTQEVCRRFNEQKCKFTCCKNGHVCLQCGRPHPRQECTQRLRCWSPLRSRGQGPQGSRH